MRRNPRSLQTTQFWIFTSLGGGGGNITFFWNKNTRSGDVPASSGVPGGRANHYTEPQLALVFLTWPHAVPADLNGPFDPVAAQNSEVVSSNPGRVGHFSSRLCIYGAPIC